MILQTLSWWVISSVLGVVMFPVLWRLFPELPDRGFSFTRIAGLLSTGYVYWLAVSLGLLPNSIAGCVVALLLVVGCMAWFMRGHWQALKTWGRENKSTLLIVELLFLVSFAVWAFVRANNPDITGTEKPMELAFINAILQSESFPPQDPWLSGYSISYYYFGYIQLAYLTRLSGVASGVAFNLGNALWFAMAITGAYGLVFDLINRDREERRLFGPILAPLFVVITGNLEAFLEVLHSRRLFWTGLDGGQPVSAFWSWLGIKDLVSPPVAGISWSPSRYFWWWRASRVVNDVNLAGVEVEVIDEFPFFSFLLADNHPHLLALPVAMLSIAFALHLFYRGKRSPQRLGRYRWNRRRWFYALAASAVLLFIVFTSTVVQTAGMGESFFGSAIAALTASLKVGLLLGGVGLFVSIAVGGTRTTLTREEFLTAALLYGGLTFQNAWDLPLYGSIFLLVIWWSQRDKELRNQLLEVLIAGAGMVIGASLLYLPWYPSFASQAGGILPNLIYPTRTPQFIVMFGTALIPLLVWVVWEARKGLERKDIGKLVLIGVGFPFLLLVLSLLLAAVYAGLALRFQQSVPYTLATIMASFGTEQMRDVFSAILERRVITMGTVLILGGMVAVAVRLLWKRFRIAGAKRTEASINTNAFVLILILVGALLILAPEYVYLRDQFGTRMNTIFKFYFAAWTVWGIGASYACLAMLEGSARSRLIIAAAMIPLFLGFLYPVFGVWTKTSGFDPPEGRTLDGTTYLWRLDVDDASAIAWIEDNLDNGVIAEAIGGSYTSYARISTHTGLQTVLGWPGHENQWRGSAVPQGSREADIRQLYQTRSWNEAEAILDRYDIDYVYVGSLERSTYQPLIDTKFLASMQLVFQQGDVQIFARLDEVNP